MLRALTAQHVPDADRSMPCGSACRAHLERVSNPIRYDSLLVRQLAAELRAVLDDLRVLSLCFDRELRVVTLAVEQGVLHWSLREGPSWSGQVADCAGQQLVLPRKPHVLDVDSLPDERILRLIIAGGQRANATATLIVELLPPQPNVIALDQGGRVLKVLAPNAGRPQTRGQPYVAPVARHRSGADSPISLADWIELLAGVPPEEREQKLIARVAFTSPINAALLGSARVVPGEQELHSAYERYLDLVAGPARPCVIKTSSSAQPYGHPLWQEATPYSSLLQAFAEAAAQPQQASDSRTRLEAALARELRKVARLEAELGESADAATQLRGDADLLISHLHTVKRGADHVELSDFSGTLRRLQLDPATTAAANAEAWYAEARKRERAALRLPGMIEKARQEVAALQAKLERVLAGETVDLPPRPLVQRAVKTEPRLPYLRFRTSGGLEVRVGRNSRANDELTLHHAAPDDIRMHARAVGGAHVVLRWPDPTSNPPQRDLEQAAALAALHSKGRHAGIVPVDWTRRKYVRKPRQAPAGSVRVERVKTVFVTPGHNLAEKLRWTE